MIEVFRSRRARRVRRAILRLRADLHAVDGSGGGGECINWPVVLLEQSAWVLVLLRSGDALFELTGRTFGTRRLLRGMFSIDIWTYGIGGGLRMPHPFNIVIGEGVELGRRCLVLHNTTVQRGAGTIVSSDCVLGAGATVLAGSVIQRRSIVGAGAVVHGAVPEGSVVMAPGPIIQRKRNEYQKNRDRAWRN